MKRQRYWSLNEDLVTGDNSEVGAQPPLGNATYENKRRVALVGHPLKDPSASGLAWTDQEVATCKECMSNVSALVLLRWCTTAEITLGNECLPFALFSQQQYVNQISYYLHALMNKSKFFSYLTFTFSLLTLITAIVFKFS